VVLEFGEEYKKIILTSPTSPPSLEGRDLKSQKKSGLNRFKDFLSCLN
jgi:hypothetical protein